MASRAPGHQEKATDGGDRRADLLVIALFWSFAFAIGSLRGTLANEIPFQLIAPHRLAVMVFGGFLCWVMVHLLEAPRLNSFRDRALFVLAAAPVLATLQSLFHMASCRIAPIGGYPPITPVEALNAGMIALGHFIAWGALQLALMTHRDAEAEGREAAPSATPTRLSEAAREKCFWASRGRQTVRIPAPEIVWAEAQRDYVLLHSSGGGGMVRETLANVEEALGDEDFVRVHRSALVRRSAIAAVRRKPSGALAVTLKTGEEVPAGRRYAPGVRALLARLDG